MDQIVSSLKQLAIPELHADELTWLKPTYKYTSYHRELASMSEWGSDLSPFKSSQSGSLLTCEELVQYDGYADMSHIHADLVHPKLLTGEFTIILDVLSLPPFSSIIMRFLCPKEGKENWKTLQDIDQKGRYYIFKEENTNECHVIDVKGRAVQIHPIDVKTEVYFSLWVGNNNKADCPLLPLRDIMRAYNTFLSDEPGAQAKKWVCSDAKLAEDERKYEGCDRTIKIRIKIGKKI